MLMVGALAPSTGQVVPLALTGAPGFVQTPTQTSLAITPDQLLDPGAPCARASTLDRRQARCRSWGPLPGQQHVHASGSQVYLHEFGERVRVGYGFGRPAASASPGMFSCVCERRMTWCGRRAGRPGADRHGVRRGRGGAGVRRRRQAHLCGQHRGAPRETPAFAVVLLLGNPGAACPVQQAPYGEPARSSTMRYGLLMRRPAGLASPCICSTEMWSTVIRICPNIGHESGPRGCARAAGGPPRDGRCRRYADARDA